MVNQTIRLNRDCEATLIPEGDTFFLEEGSSLYVTQALGGTVTLRNELGLFRINNKDLDALGSDIAAGIAKEASVANDREPFSEKQVWAALESCFDPEIPINIVDLGLIYDLRASEGPDNKHCVEVKMTLTAQGCGMGPAIAADAKQKIEALPAVESAQVDIVWEPVWTPHMISDAGRQQLGMND